MSDADLLPDAEAGTLPVEPAVAVSLTAGAMLRAARESSGLHIAALAVSLKVPVKKLEALEADRLDLLPDAVFVRALAASVCRTLKIESAPVLEKLPGAAAPRLIHDEAGINAPFRSPGDGPRPGWKDQLTRPVMLMVLALLMGALILVFLPDLQIPVAMVKEADASAAMVVQRDALIPAQPVAQIVAPPKDSQPHAVPAPAPAAVASVAALAVVAPMLTMMASPTLAISPKLAMPAAADVATDAGVVVFKAKGQSWVEVTDAKGQVALRKTLGPGESAGASGPLPLAVVVGKADVTQVSVRGKSLDLAPHSRDNVARFEVK